MPHKIHLIMDFQYGSTGKGLLAGYLAKREDYDTAICSFATNAGHTYKDVSRGIDMMTQQLPTAISSPTVKTVLLGPGSLIHMKTLIQEIGHFRKFMDGKRLLIHPHAAVVEDYHAEQEIQIGLTKMGSTAKGVGAAQVERIWRDTLAPNVAKVRFAHTPLEQYVCSVEQYEAALACAESVIIEGAQGFGLSIYHGQYPFTTSRDVTPWQIAADCGIPFKWANYIQVYGTLRTFPIRVNNRDGSSGPCYPDQREIQWSDLGIPPEKTTVTKLERRVFTFSHQQLQHALRHCAGYWNTKLFLNFANYQPNLETTRLIRKIETPTDSNPNYPAVCWIGFGPDDSFVLTRDEYTLKAAEDCSKGIDNTVDHEGGID